LISKILFDVFYSISLGINIDEALMFNMKKITFWI